MKKRTGMTAVLMAAVLLTLQGCGSSETDDTSLTEEAAAADTQAEDTQTEEITDTDAQTDEEQTEDVQNEDTAAAEAPDYDDMYHLSLVMADEKYSEFSEDDTLVVNGSRQIVRLAPEAQTSFAHDAADNQALSDAVDALMSDLKTDYEESLQEMVDVYEEGYDESLEDMMPFYSNISLSIPRADSAVMSVGVLASSFSGGAHPESGVLAYNFDSVTGKLLTLDDVITDKSQLAGLIRDGIDPDVQLLADDSYFDEAVENGTLTFLLNNAGITFYFSPYEIATYADGIVTVTIPYFNNEDMFNPAYSMALQSYTVPFQSGFPYVDYACSADAPCELTAYFTEGIYNDGTAEITIGTDKYMDTEEVPGAESAEFIYAQTIDYGVIVYADVKYDEDEEKIYAWKLEADSDIDGAEGGIEFAGSCDLGQAVYPGIFDTETTVSYFQIMACDEAMCLSDHGESGEYYIGPDFMPVKADAQ